MEWELFYYLNFLLLSPISESKKIQRCLLLCILSSCVVGDTSQEWIECDWKLAPSDFLRTKEKDTCACLAFCVDFWNFEEVKASWDSDWSILLANDHHCLFSILPTFHWLAFLCLPHRFSHSKRVVTFLLLESWQFHRILLSYVAVALACFWTIS